MSERQEPGACPTCSGPSVTTIWGWEDRDGDLHESRYAQDCKPCCALWRRRDDAFRHALQEHLPGISTRTKNCLLRSLRSIVDFNGLRAMPDDELLGLRDFGKGALAEVRASIPVPAPRPVASMPDPSVFWASRPDIFNVVGG